MHMTPPAEPAPASPSATDHPWVRGPISDQEFLIVAGTYRSGTTSMYTHLAAHPEVAASSIKEPAFFFPPRWAVKPPVYPPGHEVEAYLSLFKTGPRTRIRMEATPNYLHDPGCAARIRHALPGARVIVLLRDPVKRLPSWYKHNRYQGWMPSGTPAEQWVRAMLDQRGPADTTPYHYRALAHGCYALYVAAFLETFGRDRVLVLWFDHLLSDPVGTMEKVSVFCGISPGFYRTYSFPRENESSKILWPRLFAAYRMLHKAFFRMFQPFPRLQFRLKEIFFTRVEPPLLRTFFAGPADPVNLPEPLRRELREYYRADTEALAQLLGEVPPWAGETV